MNNGSGKQGVNPASLPASAAAGGAEPRGHHPEHEHSSPRLRATGRWRRELETNAMTRPRPLDQNARMTAAPSTLAAFPIDPRITTVVSGIVATIPEAQVRLFGSRARGTSRPDSDVDLLITVPDRWLASHDRMHVLGDLWRRFSSHQLPLDLLLYSESEVTERQQYRSAVTTRAYDEGILLHG